MISITVTIGRGRYSYKLGITSVSSSLVVYLNVVALKGLRFGALLLKYRGPEAIMDVVAV